MTIQMLDNCEKAEPESAGSESALLARGALSPTEQIGGLWRGVTSLTLKHLGRKEGEGSGGQGREPITEGLVVKAEEEVSSKGGEEVKSWGKRVEGESEEGGDRRKRGEVFIPDEWLESESLRPKESLQAKLSPGEWDRASRPWHKPYWGIEDPGREPLKSRKEGSQLLLEKNGVVEWIVTVYLSQEMRSLEEGGACVSEESTPSLTRSRVGPPPLLWIPVYKTQQRSSQSDRL